jgi:hypothetical protein
MRRNPSLALSVLVAAVLSAPAAAPGAEAGGAIHGTVTTIGGEAFTGPIRWDKNENFWDDVLNARKVRDIEAPAHRRTVNFFGLRVSRPGGPRRVHSELAVPFGHIRAIEPLHRDRIELAFKGGKVLEVRDSADLGRDMRGIVVEDSVHGSIEVEWVDVARIEFRAGDQASRDAERLYGTVTTRGARFTGFIVWDRDESLTGDILDGDGDGRGYKIPFHRIQAIRKRNRRSSEVVLTGGRSVILSGSNDVDDDNRGILITIPGVGSVDVDWNEFREAAFFEAPESLPYDAFDGGAPLAGTVLTTDGREFEGEIVWDNDEEYTWEPLDGEAVGVSFAILFENIASIRRYSKRSADVELISGEVYRLEDSNDVNDENKGIVVRLSDGERVTLGWDDFESVSFSRR